jgi:hypothetical protein
MIETMPSKRHTRKHHAKRSKRATRGKRSGASDWNKKVMKVYHEMKAKDKSVKLGDAMRECSRRKKAGKL